MKHDTSEKDQLLKQTSENISEGLTENLLENDGPQEDMGRHNQTSNHQGKHSPEENSEEKPAKEKKLRTILYSETKEINGKEEAIYDDDFLKEVANHSKKFDMMNGIDFTEYITTKKEDLSRMSINPMTDLVYEVSDEKSDENNSDKLHDENKSKPGQTDEQPNKNLGTAEKIITGSINVGKHLKQNEINSSNLKINLGRTLAHERLAHGYTNILNNITRNNLNHAKGFNQKQSTIHSPSEQYKKLRSQDTIVAQTKTNMKSLYNFINNTTNIFESGTLEYKLDKYKYTKDGTSSKDSIFSELVDKHLSDVR